MYHVSTFAIRASVAAYVEKVLIPELEPGTVIILDNLATHKNAAAARGLRRRE